MASDRITAKKKNSSILSDGDVSWARRMTCRQNSNIECLQSLNDDAGRTRSDLEDPQQTIFRLFWSSYGLSSHSSTFYKGKQPLTRDPVQTCGLSAPRPIAAESHRTSNPNWCWPSEAATHLQSSPMLRMKDTGETVALNNTHHAAGLLLAVWVLQPV